jgi:g-D-glutamyl-meso-diaminopimelate peptidase
MKRKWSSFILAGMICFGFSGPSANAAFVDIAGNTHESAIKQLYEQDIIGGYSDGTYKPDASITRAQVVRLLGRFIVREGYEIPEDALTDNRFEDVPLKSDEELLQLSALLYEEGIFQGASGYLDSRNKMQRQHMAVVIVRMMHDVFDRDLVAEYKKAGFTTSITDIHKALDDEKREAITALEYAGITVVKQFLPSNTVTRGQFASFLVRALQTVEVEEETEASQPSGEVNDQTGENLNDGVMEEEISPEALKDTEEAAQVKEQGTVQSAEQQGEDGVIQNEEILTPENPKLGIEEGEGEQPIDFSKVKSASIMGGTPLYASRNMKNQIGVWQNEAFVVPINYLADKHLIVVSAGGEKYYVTPDAVMPAALEGDTSGAADLGAVRTESTYQLLDAPNGKAILSGNRVTKLQVVGITDKYYKVKAGQKEGYISHSQTYVNTRKNIKLAEAATFSTGGKAAGELVAGAVIKASGFDGTQYKITVNGKMFTFPRQAVVETDEPTGMTAVVPSKYPETITAQADTAVKLSSGKVIGKIKANTTLELKNITASVGIIEFLGSAGYVNLSNFTHTDVVNPTKNVTHQEMEYQLKVFNLLYPDFTELKTIGKSVEGRSIYALRVGNGKKEILLDASLHAREHMTTNVLMEMIDQYSSHYVRDSKFGSYQVKSVLDQTSIWFVPMMNPDGVTLVQNGLNAVANKDLVRKINGGPNIARWKANIRGVDLNRNFDATWSSIILTPPYNVPAFKNYKGIAPFSEPESKALRDFVLARPFKSYITYHSSGEIIYWGYDSMNNYNRNYNLVKSVANVTGYSIIPPNPKKPSAASESWFTKVKKMPAMTVEIAKYSGEGPVSFSQWNDVWRRNQTVGLIGATEASKR